MKGCGGCGTLVFLTILVALSIFIAEKIGSFVIDTFVPLQQRLTIGEWRMMTHLGETELLKIKFKSDGQFASFLPDRYTTGQYRLDGTNVKLSYRAGLTETLEYGQFEYRIDGHTRKDRWGANVTTPKRFSGLKNENKGTYFVQNHGDVGLVVGFAMIGFIVMISALVFRRWQRSQSEPQLVSDKTIKSVREQFGTDSVIPTTKAIPAILEKSEASTRDTDKYVTQFLNAVKKTLDKNSTYMLNVVHIDDQDMWLQLSTEEDNTYLNFNYPFEEAHEQVFKRLNIVTNFSYRMYEYKPNVYMTFEITNNKERASIEVIGQFILDYFEKVFNAEVTSIAWSHWKK